MAVIGAIVLSGCAKARPVPAAGSPAGTVRIGQSENGRALNVAAGSRVVVVLDNTYWKFGVADRSMLVPIGKPAYQPNLTGCVPGGGCGTVTAVFRAAGHGRSVLTASRTTCGEALRCTGTNGSFRVVLTIG
jgi:hypothetical protein